MPGTFHIILNYRREDTSAHAGRLYDDLADEFGGDQVFMDIDAIEPGVDFADVIERAVGSASVFLSLIGPRWLSAVDAKGVRRLDKTDDFVRLEIEAALRPEVRVIPILVQNATMPSATDLPPSLAPLARRNAIELRDNSWRYDVGRLIETIEGVRGGQSGKDALTPEPVVARAPRRQFGRSQTGATSEPVARGRVPKARTLAAGLVAILALILALGGGLFWLFAGSEEPDVHIERVALEMVQFPTSEPKRPRNVLVANASVRFAHSAAGVEYRLKFTLYKRKGPGDPGELVGSQDTTYVLDAENDQCSCELRFEDLSLRPEYRIQVKVFHENRPTAEPLDQESSRWLKG
jgi:hypothetical protein